MACLVTDQFVVQWLPTRRPRYARSPAKPDLYASLRRGICETVFAPGASDDATLLNLDGCSIGDHACRGVRVANSRAGFAHRRSYVKSR